MLEEVKRRIAFDVRVARLLERRMREVAKLSRRGPTRPEPPSLDALVESVRSRVDARLARLLEEADTGERTGEER